MGITNIISFIKSFLFSNETRSKITFNILWRIGDKVIRLGMSLFVFTWIARFLGTEQFGMWSIAFAFITFFNALAALGVDDIASRDMVNEPARVSEILGSIFMMKIVGGGLVCLFAGVSILFVYPNEPVVHTLVLILAAGTIFQAFNAVDSFYVAVVQAKYSIIARNIAYLLVSFVMIILLITEKLTVSQIAFLTVFETLFAGILLIIFYQKVFDSVKKWRISIPYCKELLKQSWPLILSGFVVEIFLRIDQVMIGNLLGNSEAGIYYAAVRISEIWYFLPFILAKTVFPNLIETRKKDINLLKERYLKLFRMMNILTISCSLAITFCSGFIIRLLYGEAYSEAATILAIHIWAGVFSFIAMLGDTYYLIERLQRLYFFRMLFGACLNVALNFLLIPKFGIIGAAMGILITHFFVSYFIELLHKKTRILFLLKTKSFLFFLK